MDLVKLIKKLPTGFAEEAESFDTKRLEAELIKCASNMEQIETDLAGNEYIQAEKDKLRDMLAPYRDATKAQKAKTKYLLHLMEQKGSRPEGEGVDSD